MCNQNTKIKFVSNGMLIRESMRKQGLSEYSIIILDEAHERSLETDILFGILKRLQKTKQKDLKLIAMSATLDVEKFSKFFDDCPVIEVEGKMFPVSIMYTEKKQHDFLDSALTSIQQVHLADKEKLGDILVFLTGQDEIIRGCASLNNLKGRDKRFSNLLILPLYSSLPPHQQKKVFDKTPPGHRKVILSTNVAETSLTISGIRYIIDSGHSKKRMHDPLSGIEILKTALISQSEAWQRSGRAGREADGMALRLYTEEQFEKMSESIIPEIKRVNLSHVILQLKILNFNDIHNFDFMDKPEDTQITQALKELKELKALDAKYNLTAMGRKMANFPLNPQMARVLVLAHKHGCSEEIIKILSLMNSDVLFLSKIQIRFLNRKVL
eukprot:UN33141